LKYSQVATEGVQTVLKLEHYVNVSQQFSPKELVDLTLAIISVNSGIRLATSFRTVPGSYHPDSPVTIRKVPEPSRV
jgi:hypothetical protein